MKYNELRHLDGVKGNFGIADGKQFQNMPYHRMSILLHKPLYSNVKGIVDAQQFLFDTLWDKAISAAERIEQTQEEVITDNHGS